MHSLLARQEHFSVPHFSVLFLVAAQPRQAICVYLFRVILFCASTLSFLRLSSQITGSQYPSFVSQ